ncbi:MAG: bifunctional metallophosphatase/5'-nucleotidase, partial [Bacillus sp. (in: firmicutes)]
MEARNSEEENFTLSVMHTNDTHAHIENVAKRVTAVNAVREEKPNAVLVDAGDVFSGTLYFNQYKGQADLQFMNLMQYDMMTFGNHEFDLGNTEGGNTALADFVKNANFPFISSNVDFSKDKAMSSLQVGTIATDVEDGKIYDAIIKEIDGEKVGFFGLTTEETADIASPGAATFNDYIESAEQTVAALEEQGVNKIVAVTHIGYNDNALYDNDLTLAAEVDGIDLIVGGHDHTKLTEPVVVTEDSKGNEKNPTVIVQAYQYSDYLGTVDVEFDENGVVIGYAGELIDVSKQAEDAEAAEMLKEYSATIDALKNEETGATTTKELTNPRISDEGNTEQLSVRKNETELGNLITDGMLWAAKQKDANVVIAMQNGGGIRSGIDAGPITVGEVLTVLPFGNTLATMELTGAEIIEALEHSVSAFPKENGGFLHVSGMKYTFDSSKDAGSRVQSVQVQDGANGSYTDLVESKTYTVATNYFTAKGGDGFTVFAKAFADNRVKDYGQSDWETFRDYLKQLGTVNPTIEGRI